MVESTVYRCPVCHFALEKLEKQYICPNEHTFDIAREGYVNLLLAHQKRTKEPGDSKAMIESRRAFLNKGHYGILSERLNEIIVAQLSAAHQGTHLNVLDAGCGEGYFMLILEKQEEYQYKVLEMEVMPDHVHLLLDVDPKIGIYSTVAQIKGYTSRILRQKFSSLRSRLPTLWTRSKFISSVGTVTLAVVKQYIEEQRGK